MVIFMKGNFTIIILRGKEFGKKQMECKLKEFILKMEKVNKQYRLIMLKQKLILELILKLRQNGQVLIEYN